MVNTEETNTAPTSASTWRRSNQTPSLQEVHRTVAVPKSLGFWRKMLAFSGPGYLVAVGYMDPGNWATDLAGGSQFGYTLLSVILISNLMAILLQSLCAKLGIVTGRDLAQACRDHYSKPVAMVLWLLCEVAICACDLAEVVGSAIALNLLFKIPLVWGVCITALDVLAVMYLQNKGFRYIEALVVTLILTIGGCKTMGACAPKSSCALARRVGAWGSSCRICSKSALVAGLLSPSSVCTARYCNAV